MVADDSNEAALQVVDNELSVALGLDAFVVAAVHAALEAFVHSTVDLRQVAAGSGRHENH